MEASLQRKTLKYFIITLVAVLLCAFASVALQKAGYFIEREIAWSDASTICLLLAPAMLPTAIICASSMALVVVFRNTKRSFLPTLAQCALVVIPLSVAIWLYGTHIQPRLTAKTAQTTWNAQMDASQDTATYSDFLNNTPATATPSILRARIDSLQNSIRLDGEEVSYETEKEWMKYRIEKIKRNLNGIVMLVTSLLFAALGYASRKASVAKIFSIGAIVIVCIYITSRIYALVGLLDKF